MYNLGVEQMDAESNQDYGGADGQNFLCRGPGERTESHPFTPSENLLQSMSPIYPLRPVQIALHPTA